MSPNKKNKTNSLQASASTGHINFSELSVQILIEEFKHIHDLYIRQRIKRTERVNFYVGLVTAVGAGLIITSQSTAIDRNVLMWGAVITFSFLGIFGILINGNLVNNDIISDNYLRGMNRIKRYFTDRDKDLISYFIFPPEEKPILLFIKLSSIKVIIQFLIAALFSTVLFILQHNFLSSISNILKIINIVIIAFISIIGINIWSYIALKKAKKKYH